MLTKIGNQICFSFKIANYKVFELQIGKAFSYQIGSTLEFRNNQDHSGLYFELYLVLVQLFISLYDTRHIGDKNDRAK